MKLLILILFLPSLLLPSDFSNISSVNFDLVGVVASGDKIAAYGTKGSVYYSDDDAQSWNVIKPFETGNIVNFFIESDKLVAFLQTGEVSQSYDNGINWSVTNPIDDSVAYVVKGNDDYYVRAQSSIIKLNSNLSLSNNFQYPYYYGFDITYHYSPTNRMQMSYLDNKLFVFNHYMNAILVLDENLNQLDSVDIGKKLLNNSNIFISRIMNTTENLIIKLHNYNIDSTYIYKLDPNFTELKVLLNFSESVEKRKELFKEKSYSVTDYNIYKNKLYTFNGFTDSNNIGPNYNIFELISKDSAVYNGVIDAKNFKAPSERIQIEEFVIENDRITGVGKGNLIVSKKLNSESTQRISNLVGSDNYSNLIKINDSEFMLQTAYNLYKSTDTTKTFNKVVGDSSIFKSYYKLRLRFNYFDEEAKRILYFAYSLNAEHIKDPPYVLVSDDYGESFIRRQLEELDLKNLANSYSISKIKNNYLISETNFGIDRINYLIYDENFNFLESKVDTIFRYFEIFGNDLNKFTFLGSSTDFDDSYQYLKSTIDGGQNWNDIREFSFTIDTIWYSDSTKQLITPVNELRYYKTIENKGNSYLLLVTYNHIDSLYKVEAMDLKTNEFNIIFQNKQSSYSNTIVELIDDTFYIGKDDTLFTTTDLFDYKSWKGQKLPNNGNINVRIMKSGDYLITYYYDDIHPYDIYRINWNELTTTSIEENDIETYTYFYNSPPYPQPTSSIVTTKIYLDQGISLSKAGIKVYDMNGIQVEKGDNIEVSGSNWPTTLKWDSSNQPLGVYFIVVDYGENSRAIKVMKK